MDEVITQTGGDIDGDGQPEAIYGGDNQAERNLTEAYRSDGSLMWATNRPIDGWVRSANDRFELTADVDGDGRQEILVNNPVDKWTGLFKWEREALHTPWASPSPIDGWQRSGEDAFFAADIERVGRYDIVIANEGDGWMGVLNWDGAGLRIAWASPSPLTGPAGSWYLRRNDVFRTGPQEYRGQWAITILRGSDNSNCVLFWQQNALQMVEVVGPH